MAAAGGAVNSGVAGDGVRLATVVREQGVAVDGLSRPSQPADHQGTDPVGGRAVGRHRHSGSFELHAKAYRPVAYGQNRVASPLAPRGDALGQLVGRDRRRLHRRAVVTVDRGEDLAAARVDHREHGPGDVRFAGQVELLRARELDPAGERLEAGDADDRQVVALAQRSRGRDAEPQPGEPAGPGADADPRDVLPRRPGACSSACSSSGCSTRRVARALVGGGIVAAFDLTTARHEDGDGGGTRRRVDSDDCPVVTDRPRSAADRRPRARAGPDASRARRATPRRRAPAIR